MPPERKPPAVARALILALTPARWREELDGDLREGYESRCRSLGRLRARAWYWRQLLSLDVVRLRRLERESQPAGRSRRGVSSALAGLRQDARYALRALRKSPGFTAITLATLAIGIGANTAVFGVVNGVLIRPLPYPDPDRLAMVFRTAPRFGFTRSTSSYPDFADWRAEAESFESLAAYGYTTATYAGGEGAERWEGYRITAELIPTLGIEPAIGRSFRGDDDRPGAAPVILLSHGIWRSRFGGAPGIVGGDIVLDGAPVTVVGVMPPGYAFPSSRAEFWVPLRGDAARMERDSNFLTVVGRLRPGVSIAEAQTEMEALAARIDAGAEAGNQGMGVFVESRHAFMVRNARTALLVFLGAVALVLIGACVNVANLMLSRGTARRRELAVRRAVGADPGRLVRQLLTESALIGLGGGALGLGLAGLLLRALVAAAPPGLPRLNEVSLDPAVLAFTAILSLGCGIGFGAAPALLGARADIGESLKEGGSVGLGRPGRRLQESLVVAQVALAIVLSIGAGLMLGSFARLSSVEPGFDPTHVIAGRVAPRSGAPAMEAGMTEAEMQAAAQAAAAERRRFFTELTDGVAGLPGVSAVGLSFGLPLGGYSFSRYVVPEGLEVEQGAEPTVAGNIVDGDYFAALGIPLIQGRAFTAADGPESMPVAVVSRSLARRFWPGDDPIGKRMSIGDQGAVRVTVVGVAGDVHGRSLTQEPEPMYYRPLAQAGWPDGMFVVVRSAIAADELANQLRRQVWSLDPTLPLTDLTTADGLLARTKAEPRFRTLVLSVFGTFAVILAQVGIYGVISYAVGERVREIGLRLALGARAGGIVALVLKRGTRLTLLGIGIGVAGALAFTRFLGGMLFQVAPHDAATFAAAALLLLLVSALASYVPARRAARVDPVITLRE